jgi:hypothetical protein
MGNWDMESAKTIAVFIAAFGTILNWYEKYFRKPKLVLKVDSIKLIEDYPGELGMQLNVVLRAYNGSCFLKGFELNNINEVVNKTSEISLEVREYVCEDIIKKYLELQRDTTTIIEREDRKLDQFIYDEQLRLKEVDFRTDSITGNFINSVTESDFQNSLNDLCRKQVIHENRYKEISKKIESVRDLKVDNGVSLSLTLFAHIYGHLDGNIYKRKDLPLDGWRIIIKHSEGELKRKIKAEKISYSQVKELIGGFKENTISG